MSKGAAARNHVSNQRDALVAAFGFVPNLFRAQSDLPRAIEGEANLIDAVVVRENKLSRNQKAVILSQSASARRNNYCRALFGQLPPLEAAQDSALLGFALKLAKHAFWISEHEVESLRSSGFDDEVILETIQVVAVGVLLCTLAKGFQPAVDAGVTAFGSDRKPEPPPFPLEWMQTPGPYLNCRIQASGDFRPYVVLREQLGFVPNVFKEQMQRPEAVQAEVQALEQILFPEDALTRVQKENILLALAAANANTYFVALHSQVLSALGISNEDSDQIVEDHHHARIAPAEVVLLDEVLKLAYGRGTSEAGFECEPLRAHGFTEPQIIEAVATAGLANFLHTLQAGLGAVPDFPPRRTFTPKDLYRSSRETRPILDAAPDDPDGALVARVQSGDTDAFEDLVRRHTRRIFGVLAGLVGNMDDARDAAQEVFLKAFEHIGRFQGRSKFSTWLTSIAINTGTELLRRRRPSESLNEVEDEDFRPRQVQSWGDNPEQLLTASQRNELVRKGILCLPQKYRVAVLLRDINQLSTEESAAALGLSIPAMKARVLRGRLMLRESLAPYFMNADSRSPDA